MLPYKLPGILDGCQGVVFHTSEFFVRQIEHHIDGVPVVSGRQPVQGHTHNISQKICSVPRLPRRLNCIHHQAFVKIVDSITERHGVAPLKPILSIRKTSDPTLNIEVAASPVTTSEQFCQRDWQVASLPT